MAVKLVPMTCPNCKASIEVDTTKDFCFCTYCGTKIFINDDSTKTININTNINHQYIERDEARIKEADAHEKIELAKLNSNNKQKKTAIIIGALLILISIVVFSIVKMNDTKQNRYFEQLSQEVLTDIENGNYSSARLKANQIHYTADWSAESETKWDAVRETLLEEIAKAENGGELPKESLGDKISNLFNKDE